MKANCASNFSLEPTAAVPSGPEGIGRCAAPWLRRRSVSDGCGSVPSYAS